MGAYEAEDTQLKIAAAGVADTAKITHTLTSYGAYWVKNAFGNWVISSDQYLSSAAVIDTGNRSSDLLYEWKGVEYKWLDRSDNSEGKRIAAGLYKVSNNRSSAFFYLDLRDAVINYNLNAYILYDHNISRYSYRNATTGDFFDIISGNLVRIWDINNNGNHNISGLDTSYWSNALVQVNGVGQNPRLIWGPKNANYTVERNGTTITTNPITDLEFVDQTIVICSPGVVHQNVDYLVKNSLNNPTNEVSVKKASIEKDNITAERYDFKLNQNYPNPFNPMTTILFSLAKKETVRLKIYDITGSEVKTLVDGEYDAGIYNVEFNASQLSSGVYFYQIIAGDFKETKKLQVLK
jgi:hypothetical protein